MVTGQLPLSPVVFLAAGEACGAVADGGLSTLARTVESAEEISDAGAPELILRAAGPGRDDRG